MIIYCKECSTQAAPQNMFETPLHEQKCPKCGAVHWIFDSGNELEEELFNLHNEICSLIRKRKRLRYYLERIRDEMNDKGYDSKHFATQLAMEALGGD